MLKKFCLCAVASSTLLLAGCASTDYYEEKQAKLNAAPYDETISRAGNITRPFRYFYFERVPDADAPEGWDSDDGSVLLNAAGWASGFHAAAGSGFLPGTSNWGTGLGIGLGLSLATAILAPTPIEEENAAFGYVPVEQAKTVAEARNLFGDKVIDAVHESLKKKYPNAKFELFDGFMKATRYYTDTYIKFVGIVDPSIGCLPYSEAGKDESKRCGINIGVGTPKEPTLSQASLLPQIMAYRIERSEFTVIGSKEQGFDWTPILASTSNYLPEHTYIYLAPVMEWKNPFTKVCKSPMMVLEKNRINFFVKPKTQESK